MQNKTIYRKNYKGDMLVIGHLSSDGYEHHYATFLDPNESLEQQRESHSNRCCKNKLGFYIPLSRIKEELKQSNLLQELRK